MKLFYIKSVLFLCISFLFSFSIFGQDDCIDSTKIDSISMQYHCIEFFGYHDGSFDPVCGCDSITYNHAFCASNHGVTEFRLGACSCIEPSFIDTTKDLIHFVLYPFKNHIDPVKGCDGNYYITPEMAVSYGGVTSFDRDSVPCVEKKYIDTTIDLSMFPDYPVCGCDKKTYRNKLEAFFYGGNLSWKDGRCECIDVYKIDTTVFCTDEYEPVCGCDRVTYQNQCIAENHYGIQYTKPGDCPCKDTTLIQNDSVYWHFPNDFFSKYYIPVCGCDSITYANLVIAQYLFGVAHWTDGACKCIDSTQIDTSAECHEIYHAVIGCDGKFYKNECEARYKHGVMSYELADCFEELQIDSTIECNPVFNYDPVCGCKVITYPNLCYAKYYAGVTRWYYGECIGDTTCINKFLIDTFKYCSDTYDPVCGCDSITYTNECIAKYRNGVKSWTQGSCTTSTENINGNFTNTNFVNVYPNPFSNNITLAFIDNNFPELITIYDMYGRKVKKVIIDRKTSKLNLNDIPTGIYFITIKTKNNIFTKKIVKISSK